MFTVLSNTRNSNMYILIALAVTLVVITTFAVAPSLVAPKAVMIPETGGQNAHDLFRSEELALYNHAAPSSIGSPAYFEYRRGEWQIGTVDAMSAFRREELSLYNRSTASSLGGEAFYEYRRGEWPVQTESAQEQFRQEELALYNHSAISSIGSASYYEYRRGEWFGN